MKSAATTAADDLLDAIGELYGNGDIRFDSETPRRAAVEARAALLAEIEHLRAALDFYAAPSTYEEQARPHPTRFASGVIPIEADEGARAREALNG